MDSDESVKLAVMSSQFGDMKNDLADLKKDTRESFREVKAMIAGLNYVPRGEYELTIKAQATRLEVLEGKWDWAIKIFVTQIFAAIVAGIAYGAYYK